MPSSCRTEPAMRCERVEENGSAVMYPGSEVCIIHWPRVVSKIQGSNGSCEQGTVGAPRKLTFAAPALSSILGISCFRHRSSSFPSAPCADCLHHNRARLLLVKGRSGLQQESHRQAPFASHPFSSSFNCFVVERQVGANAYPGTHRISCATCYIPAILHWSTDSVHAFASHLLEHVLRISLTARASLELSSRAFPRSSPSSLCCSSHSLPSLDHYIDVVSDLYLLQSLSSASHL
jgi:hypothetical protein